MSRTDRRALTAVSARALALAASTCVVAAALASPATAGHTAHRASTSAPQHAAVHRLHAHLNGSNEVPNGDPDGTGAVTVRLRPAAGRVCAHATWQHIGKPVAAHIHHGRAGVSGPVVIDLTSSVTGGSHCATGVRKALIHRILVHPRRFYFNIHTSAYPAGAIRGQLH